MRLAGILLCVILVLLGIGYWYYSSSQAKISILTFNNAKLETAIQLSEQAVTDLQEDQRKINQELTQVNTEFATIRRQNSVLEDKLRDHDIGLLGEAKPELVEIIIDRASAKALRCFELLSGAELTTTERNAKNENAFNSECPWLYNDLVISNGLQP